MPESAVITTSPNLKHNVAVLPSPQLPQYLCPDALVCHLFQAGLELLQEGLTPALQMLTGEGCGLQNERHTASTY